MPKPLTRKEPAMIVIRTAEEMARALGSPLDPQLKHCLQTHWDRLSEWHDYELSELAVFLIVETGDTLEQAEAAFGRPLVIDSTFAILPELIDRRGGWIEVTFILSDDGFGLVLLIKVGPAADERLLAACRNASSDIDNTTAQ